MKVHILIFVIFCSVRGYSQLPASFSISAESMLNTVKKGDSLVYYQCHVEEATQQISTVSGQSFTSTPQKYSITEKYVVIRDSANYRCKVFISSMIILPNRKFSGLKIRERPYWNFKKEKETILTEKDLRYLTALENKGREAIEYDFVVNKNSPNQLIIKNKKNFKQLVIDGNYILSKLLFKQ